MKRIVIVILLMIFSPVYAQETTPEPDAVCPVPLQTALDSTFSACNDIESGMACFGYDTVTALPVDDADDFAFSTIGDTANLRDIQWMSVSTEAHTWGIARFNVQTYRVGSWDVQDVTMLIFGNTQVQNAGQEGVTITTLDLTVTASEGANIRVQPDTDFRVIRPVTVGDVVKATGRLADNSWVRVLLPDGQTGWLAAGAFGTDVEIDTLGEVEPDEVLTGGLYRPMASFSLQSGIDDAACANVPESGVLIQTPLDSGAIALRVNGVDIQLSGTAFLQAQPLRALIVNVLTGQAEVSAVDVTQTVSAGERVLVPMDAAPDSTADPLGPPDAPGYYAYDRVASLPFSLLPFPAYATANFRSVIIAPPRDGSDPLATVPVTGVCTIAAVGDVNVRSAPNTQAPVIGEMIARESAQPDGLWSVPGQTPWWRLTPGAWISWEAVFFEGDCEVVPRVELPVSN